VPKQSAIDVAKFIGALVMGTSIDGESFGNRWLVPNRECAP